MNEYPALYMLSVLGTTMAVSLKDVWVGFQRFFGKLVETLVNADLTLLGKYILEGLMTVAGAFVLVVIWNMIGDYLKRGKGDDESNKD